MVGGTEISPGTCGVKAGGGGGGVWRGLIRSARNAEPEIHGDRGLRRTGARGPGFQFTEGDLLQRGCELAEPAAAGPRPELGRRGARAWAGPGNPQP